MKKFFSILAMSAIVLGMASCGDGNEPEAKDFQFKIEALSTSAHYIVTPVNNDAYFYCSCYFYSDGFEKTLKEFTESKNYQVTMSYKSIVKGQPIEQYMYDEASDTRFIVWACYVEEGENGKMKVVGDISYKIFKTMPEGTLNGEFSVSKNKKVHFSQGNLELTKDAEFRFFDYQWEYLGTSDTDPRDLFPWNVIGEYKANNSPWFVLNNSELYYLFFTRDNAEKLFAHATLTVDDQSIEGLILLPDNWDAALSKQYYLTTDFDMGISIIKDVYYAAPLEEAFNGYAQNTFDKNQWTNLEFAGAVFLPAALITRYDVHDVFFGLGWYWSASSYNTEEAEYLSFEKYQIKPRVVLSKTRYMSIRPVRVVD